MQVTDYGDEYRSDGAYVGHRYEYNGTTIYVYMPRNNSNSHDATIYYPGMNGYNQAREYLAMSEYYNNGNADGVFIAVANSENGVQTENINAIMAYINSHGTNLNINNITGFSLGGGDALNRFTEYVTNNPNSSCNLTLYDPYGGFPRDWPAQGQYARRDKPNADGSYTDYNPELMSAMRANCSQVRIFTPTSRVNDFIGTQFMNSLARNNIPTVLIGTSSGHNQIRNDTTADGWNAYYDGKTDITGIQNAERYQVYVPTVDSTGAVTWSSYSLADIQNAYLNPNEASPELLNALNQLEATRTTINFDYINEIGSIKNIASELFGLASAPQISYASSSNLLPAENELLSSIFNVCRTAGDTLGKEVNLITNASEEYLALENRLNKMNNELNNNLASINVPTMPSSEPSINEPPTSDTQTESTPEDSQNIPSDDNNEPAPVETPSNEPTYHAPSNHSEGNHNETPTLESAGGSMNVDAEATYEIINDDEIISDIEELLALDPVDRENLSSYEIITKLEDILSDNSGNLKPVSSAALETKLQDIINLKNEDLSVVSNAEIIAKLNDIIETMKKESN